MIIETSKELRHRDGRCEILRETLNEYVTQLMSSFFKTDARSPNKINPDEIPEKIFDILTGREFCYLSKSQVVFYKKSIVELLHESVRAGDPLRFYFDIGGGYHASTRPGESGVCYDVGIAELFVLSQISIFCERIGEHYPGGAVFRLVIDNMCAHLINDIPLEKTMDYCESLRNLIRETGMEGAIEVLVESEHFSSEEYHLSERSSIIENDLERLTLKEHENVSRFLGRHCDATEAAERLRRYKMIIETSERLLERIIRGVHMTQRASESTICFRPFPGADSRIQCGEVAIGRNNKNRLRPLLLTSRNIMDHDCTRFQFAELLPKSISHVTYAEHKTSG